jgi:adenylate cyclase
MSSPPDALHEHADLIEREASAIVRKAMLGSGVMGVSSAIILVLMQRSGAIQHMEVPILWALCGGLYSLLVAWLARDGKLRGTGLRVHVLTLTLFPTLMFVYGAALTPAGAATYITGPASYLYYFFIVLAGLLFDPKLALATGASSAFQYAVAAYFARKGLSQLEHPDALMRQDLVAYPIYFFKSLMMLFTGWVVGVWSRNTNRLLGDILSKERARASLDRLFGEYVSPEAKAAILAASEKRGGEKRSMAILFSDIRDYTSMTEGRDPEPIVEQLNEYFEAMVRCVRERGGVVDKFIGDAVMATFGGLLRLDDPCTAAVDSATDMLRELEVLNESWTARGLPSLRIGVGVHFGEAVQGSIGSHDRKEFTVIGDAVNTAARLESLTKGVGVRVAVSNDVQTRLGEQARGRLRSLGMHRLKGKQREVEVWGIDLWERRSGGGP